MENQEDKNPSGEKFAKRTTATAILVIAAITTLSVLVGLRNAENLDRVGALIIPIVLWAIGLRAFFKKK